VTRTSLGVVLAYGLQTILKGILHCFIISLLVGTLYIVDLRNLGLLLPKTSGPLIKGYTGSTDRWVRMLYPLHNKYPLIKYIVLNKARYWIIALLQLSTL